MTVRGGCASAPRKRRGGLAGSMHPAGLRLAGSVLGAGGLALLGAGIVAGPPRAALAAPAGGQTGTFWVGNVGHDSGESTDPHLDCTDLELRGSSLAASSGTFQIIGWPPSGSQTQDYPLPAGSTATWTYDTAAGGV